MKISWTSKKIISKHSKVSGSGVFANADIKKNERVAVFGGFVVAIEELENIKENDENAHGVILEIGYQIEDDLILSPIKEEQYSVIEYLNHSCQPNCGFCGALNLVAITDIKKGDELFMDYAMSITLDIFDMECECGSSNCREFISGNDWTRLELQQKYKGYFQPYIEKKIKQMNQN